LGTGKDRGLHRWLREGKRADLTEFADPTKAARVRRNGL